MNKCFRACDWSEAWAERAENRVSGSRRAAERERRAGVTKVGSNGERQISRSHFAHMLCLLVVLAERWQALWA